MTDIFLYPGEPNPNDIRLRNPLAPGWILVGSGALAAIFSASYVAWSASDNYPQAQNKVVISGAAPVVNNPPLRQALDYFESYNAWAAPENYQQQPNRIVTSGPVVASQPFSRQATDYSGSYAAWDTVGNYPQPQNRIIVSVDNPPRLRIDYSSTYAAWQAPDQLQQRGPLFVPAASVVSVVQPYSIVPLLSASYTSWVQPDPPQQSARNLPPSFLAVRVDNPPIVQLANLPAASYAVWTISLEPPYIQYPYMVGAITGNPTPPANPFDYVTWARHKGRR